MTICFSRRLFLPATVFFLVLLLSVPQLALAQTDPDTSRVYELNTVVVIADRSAGTLSSSTTAVSAIRAEEVRQLPLTSLANALETIPGFSFLNLDGLGYDPQTIIRGFYGGGEAEYVVMLVDGQPINGLERGLINWNLLSIDNIESIEAVKGGASSLYGDAAIGGVVNVITRGGAYPSTRLALRGGSFDTYNGYLNHRGRFGTRRYSLSGGLESTQGYRSHADRTFGNINGAIDLLRSESGNLTLSTLNHWRQYNVPGALTTTEVNADPRQSSPFHKFDETREQYHQVSLNGKRQFSSLLSMTGFLNGEIRSMDAVQTLVLAADFADTQERDLNTGRAFGSVQLTAENLSFLNSKITAGIDASFGTLDNKYYAIMLGTGEDYASTSTAPRGDLLSSGEAQRLAYAGYLQYDALPVNSLRLSLGVRFDGIDDRFDPVAPSEGDRLDTKHSAFSPRIGVNWRYVAARHNVGNIYANYSQSFKTPTLDQLYDQRTIPVPFPPFQVSLSNPDLKPQEGNSIEVGLYHRIEQAPDRFAGEISLAVYQMDMVNELDFNLETLTYINIGKSRHRGVESGLKLYAPGGISAFFNYTLQDVTFSNGDNKGNHIRAIPRDLLVFGLSGSHRSGLGASLKITGAKRIFLNDQNTITLPDYTTVDARVAYRFQAYTIELNVFNLFDEAYSTTGFPDPAGSDVVFLYPAAGRYLQLGLSVDL